MSWRQILPFGLLLAFLASVIARQVRAEIPGSLCNGYSDTSQPSGLQNVCISPGSGSHQVEISIARSPHADSVFLVGLMAQRLLNDSVSCNFSPPPPITLGYYTSTDAGQTWFGGDTLPNSLLGPADPVVAIDRNGRFFYAYDDHWLQKSTDGGISWSTPDTIDKIWTQKDRPHLAIDVNNTNMVGFAWYEPPGKIWLVRSLDSGETFGTRQLLGDEALEGCGKAHSPRIAFGDRGVVFVCWPYGGSGNQFSCGFRLARSTDFGDTFTTMTFPFQGFGYGWQGCLKGQSWPLIYANGFPVIAVDTTRGVHRGRLYVVWAGVAGQGAGTPDIWLTFSDDSGSTWHNPPVRVNDDEVQVPRDQWFPQLDVDPGGGVNVVFYDSRRDPQNFLTEIWMARSVDGGLNFANFRVSDNSFWPCGIQEKTFDLCGWFGDYCGIASNSNWIIPAWMELRFPGPIVPHCGAWRAYVARVPTSISDTQYASGAIHNDTTWRWNVVLTGDVTIDSGVTLFVKRGAHIISTGFSDDQHAGRDTALVEISVKGTLQMDWAPGTPPLFTSDNDTSDAWGGLVFLKGGRFVPGIGATVENAKTGVTIDSLADAPEIRGITVRDAAAAGFWCESDNVRLVHDSVVNVSSGSGIYLAECGPLVDSCVLLNCQYGIYGVGSSSTIRNCKITGSGTLNGIALDSAATGEVRGVRIDNPGVAGIWCESDSIRFVRDTVTDVAQGYGMYLNQCAPRVDSCVFQNCEYGIYAFGSSSVILGCDVQGPGLQGIAIRGIPDLDTGSTSPKPEIDITNVISTEVTGYFTSSHLSVGYRGYGWIDSCTFETNLGDGRSPVGVSASWESEVHMRRSKILSYGNSGFSSFQSPADLGLSFSPDFWGNNQIYTDTQYVGIKSVRYTWRTTPDTLKAESNWWGDTLPPSSWFTSLVDYTPYLTSQPLGKLVPQVEVQPTAIPADYAVAQNYPNPFNPSTVIEFSLSAPSRVEVRVFNILGQVVKELADREFPAGHHQLIWDGTDARGRAAPSGIYFYRILNGNRAESKRMVLLK